MRDFMASRRVGGRQQIRTAITFHSAGQQILWPYGYTRANVPWDMTGDDFNALVALGKKLATTNGYTPMQSSDLYITDGDEIDYAYGVEGIFMYTFELYPTHSQSDHRFYPPDEVIGPQTERNREAILLTMEAAGCPYALTGKTRTHCGALYDDFETYGGWITNQLGKDTAKAGQWQRANPAATTRQSGTVTSGSRAPRHRPEGGQHGRRLTTWTAASPRFGPRPWPSPTMSDRSRSGTTSRTAPTRRRRTTSPGGLRRGRERRDRSSPGARCRQHGPAVLGDGDHRDDAVGRADRADRVRSRRSRAGEQPVEAAVDDVRIRRP